MSTLYRAQILLEPEQHRALTELAQQEKRSLSELMREIVGQYLAERAVTTQKQRELAALEALVQMRRQIQAQHGLYQGDWLAEARAEQEQDLERIWQAGA